jgi:hypothetical protein
MRKPEIRNESRAIAVTLTALAIVFSQFFYFQPFNGSKCKVETEQQHDHQDEGQVYFSLPSSSLPSSTHVELSQTMFFLFEIIFEIRESEERNFSVLLPLNRFFKTLFDGVISPNAP